MKTNGNDPLYDINLFLQRLQNSMSKPNQIKNILKSIQDLIPKLSHDMQYKYYFFIAEIQGQVLQDYKEAERILNMFKVSLNIKIKLGALLRLSFIYSLQNRYQQALKEIQRAQTLSTQSSELEQIMHEYIKKIKSTTKDKKSLQGMIYLHKNDQLKAVKCFIDEYNTVKKKDDKYFAAKMIEQHQLNQNKTRKIKEFIDGYLDEHLDELGEVNRSYENKKRFLNRLAKYQSISRLYGEIQELKMRAYNKIQAVLQYDQNLQPSARVQLAELKDNLLDQNFRVSREILLSFVGEQKVYEQSLHKKTKFHETQSIQHQQRDLPIHSESPTSKPKNPFVTTSMKKSYTQQYNPNLRNHRTDSYILDQNNLMDEEQLKEIGSNLDSQFKGSELVKINATSEGTQKRYFHIRLPDIEKNKLKIYYCNKKKNASENNDYYDLKNIKKITRGKTTDALKRPECDQFPKQNCFTIYTDTNQRNFYAPDANDYKNWLNLLQNYLTNKKGLKQTTTAIKQSKPKKQKPNNEQFKNKSKMESSKIRKSKASFV